MKILINLSSRNLLPAAVIQLLTLHAGKKRKKNTQALNWSPHSNFASSAFFFGDPQHADAGRWDNKNYPLLGVIPTMAYNNIYISIYIYTKRYSKKKTNILLSYMFETDSDILYGNLSGILSGKRCGVLAAILSGMLSSSLPGILYPGQTVTTLPKLVWKNKAWFQACCVQLQHSLCWCSKDLGFNQFLEITLTFIYGDR